MILSKVFSKPSVSPTRLLIAVSLTTASIAGTATSASAAACQATANGCVLPILIGLAALAGLLWLLLDDDEEDIPSPG